MVTEESEKDDGGTLGGETVWSSRIHHDWQRGNPIGYYAPDMEPRISGGKTLVLAHKILLFLTFHLSDSRMIIFMS